MEKKWFKITFKDNSIFPKIIYKYGYRENIYNDILNNKVHIYSEYNVLEKCISSIHQLDDVELKYKDFYYTDDGINFNKINELLKNMFLEKISKCNCISENIFVINYDLLDKFDYYENESSKYKRFLIIIQTDRVIVRSIKTDEIRQINPNKDYRIKLISETTDHNHSKIENEISKYNNSILYNIIINELKNNPLLDYIELDFGSCKYIFAIYIFMDKIVLEEVNKLIKGRLINSIL